MNGEKHHGPPCRCGSRATKRLETGRYCRLCQECGQVFSWRVCNGHIVPFSVETAKALDATRGKHV